MSRLFCFVAGLVTLALAVPAMAHPPKGGPSANRARGMVCPRRSR